MKIEIDEKYLDKQDNMFFAMMDNLRKFLASYLTKDDKENIQMGYVSTMVLMRICANIGISLGFDKESFLTGCANMYDYEQLSINTDEQKKEISKTDLN